MTTAKKAAAPAKKTAASAPAKAEAAKTDETTTPSGNDDQGTSAAEADAAPLTPPADSGSVNAASVVVESGPGTGAAAPPETTARPPATIVNESPDAAPLSPPADSHLQREPALGHPKSSTDQTYAEVGGQTVAGENHVRLVNRAGETLDVANLFTDPGGRYTHVVATERVYELFTYPGTRKPDKRLLYAAGAHVPRAQAARIKAAARADAEAAASTSK